MRTVVADTGPLNYLVLIDQVAILPALFETILVPASVWAELTHPKTRARLDRATAVMDHHEVGKQQLGLKLSGFG